MPPLAPKVTQGTAFTDALFSTR